MVRYSSFLSSACRVRLLKSLWPWHGGPPTSTSISAWCLDSIRSADVSRAPTLPGSTAVTSLHTVAAVGKLAA